VRVEQMNRKEHASTGAHRAHTRREFETLAFISHASRCGLAGWGALTIIRVRHAATALHQRPASLHTAWLLVAQLALAQEAAL